MICGFIYGQHMDMWSMWGSQKWGYPNSWMIFDGQWHRSKWMMTGGSPMTQETSLYWLMMLDDDSGFTRLFDDNYGPIEPEQIEQIRKNFWEAGSWRLFGPRGQSLMGNSFNLTIDDLTRLLLIVSNHCDEITAIGFQVLRFTFGYMPQNCLHEPCFPHSFVTIG